jgi:uncharacterized protein involved in outer membrane biogenesis
MKIFKVMLSIVLVVFVLAFVGLGIFLKAFNLNQYKDQIAQKISEALHRPMGIENLSLEFSWKQGIALEVKGVSIKEDPAFAPALGFESRPLSGEGTLATIESVHLFVDVAALFNERRFVISQVEVVSPQLTIIRNPDGELNVQRLVAASQNVPPAPPTEQNSANAPPANQHSPSSKTPTMDQFALSIEALRINNGKILFIDKSQVPPLNLGMEQLNVEIQHFSLDKPFLFNFDGSVLAQQKNCQGKGTGQVDAAQGQLRLDDTRVSLDFSSMDVSLLKEYFEGPIAGEANLHIAQMVVGKEGLMVLSGKGEVINGRIKPKNFKSSIDHIDAQWEMSEADLALQELSMNVGPGKVITKGRSQDYLKTNKFSFHTDVEDVFVDQVVDFSQLPIKFEGKLNGSMDVQGEGMDPAKMLSTLSGQGHYEINEGVLRGMNILKLFLESVSQIGNLGEKLHAQLSDYYKEKLAQEDTVFDQITADAYIKEGIISVTQAQAKTAGFHLLSHAQIDLAQNIDMDASFSVEKDLTDMLVAAAEQFAYIADESGRIRVPAKHYHGPLASLKVQPDTDYLLKTVFKNAVQQDLKQLLRKALDIEDVPEGQHSGNPQPNEGSTSGQDSSADSSADSPADSPAGSPAQENKGNPEDILLENVLDMIFK